MVENLKETLFLVVLVFGSVPFAIFGANVFVTRHPSATELHRDPAQRLEKWAGWALTFCICWCFSEIFQALLLGCLGLFKMNFAGCSHGSLFFLGFFLLRIQKSTLTSDLLSPSSSISLPLDSKQPKYQKSKILISFLVVFLAISGLNLWSLIVWPPVEADTLGYHFPLIAKLMQTGKISFLNYFWFQEHFPRNWEMLCALFALPMHGDILLLGPNLLAQIIFGLSIVCLALKAGASEVQSAAAGLLILGMPILSGHLMSMNVDLPFAGFVLAAFYYTLVFSKSKSWHHFWILLMTVSLYMGIKSTGALYLLVNLSLLVGLLLSHSDFSFRNWKSRGLKFRMLCFLLLLIPGIFWYAYNFILFGNPWVGVEISLLGKTLFPGPYTVSGLAQSSLLKVFNPLEWHDYQIYFQQVFTQLSYVFFALLALSFVYFSTLLAKPQKLFSSIPAFVILLLTGITFILYLKTPFSGNYNASPTGLTDFVGQAFRFGFPALGLLAVLGALGLEKLKIKDSLLFWIMLLVLFLSLQFSWKVKSLICLAMLCFQFLAFPLLSKGAVMGWHRIIGYSTKVKVSLICIVGLFCIFFFSFSWDSLKGIRFQNLAKRSYGPLVAFLDKDLQKSEKITFVVSLENYNFWGSHFRHEVEYRPLGLALESPSQFSKWMSSLQAENVAILAIGPASADTMQNLRQQFSQYPELLQPIFGNAESSPTTLYKVNFPSTIPNF